MKKRYIKPEIECIEPEEQILLSISAGNIVDDGEDADGFMSKGDDGWDDFDTTDGLYTIEEWKEANLWQTNVWEE